MNELKVFDRSYQLPECELYLSCQQLLLVMLRGSVFRVHLSDRAVCRALINKFLCLFVVYQVEYDLLNSSTDDLRLISSERIEQSAVPQCFAWYPPIVKENFLVVANDQVLVKE